MQGGHIQQIGDPKRIYDEPKNAFVAAFIGESNILHGTMVEDDLVEICGRKFECVDEGFGHNVPVDVVVRPEDVMVVGEDVGMLVRRGYVGHVQGRALRDEGPHAGGIRLAHTFHHDAASGQPRGPDHSSVQHPHRAHGEEAM